MIPVSPNKLNQTLVSLDSIKMRSGLGRSQGVCKHELGVWIVRQRRVEKFEKPGTRRSPNRAAGWDVAMSWFEVSAIPRPDGLMDNRLKMMVPLPSQV